MTNNLKKKKSKNIYFFINKKIARFLNKKKKNKYIYKKKKYLDRKF